MNNSQITSDTRSPNNLGIFVVHSREDLRTIQMNVKIDTKEIFYVISFLDSELTANMSADLQGIIAKKQEEEAKSLIFNFSNVRTVDLGFSSSFTELAANVYKSGKSFVICNLNEGVKEQFDTSGHLAQLNFTPTESEAWDIVQMEEIERELGAEFPE